MTVGIRIEQPSLNLRVDWGAVFDTAVNAGAAALAPSPGAIGAVLRSIRQVIKAEEPERSRAWLLVGSTFVVAIDLVFPGEEQDEERRLAIETMEKVVASLPEQEFFLTADFFDRPANCPLYQHIRDTFVAKLDQSAAPDLVGQLDGAMNSARNAMASEGADLFGGLQEKAKHGAEAAQAEEEWRKYRAHLVAEVEEKPLWGQEDTGITLSQLFVPTRALRAGTDDKEVKRDHLVDLATDLRDWLNRDDYKRNAVAILSGGPGCGKSSFAKMFAAEMARDQNWRPLLIELQRVKDTDDLADLTGHFFCRRTEDFSESPISDPSVTRPFLLIFDGLDELVFPDSGGAKTVADKFWAKLHHLMADMNSGGRMRAYAIVTGRQPIIDAALKSFQGRKTPASQIYEACGYQPIDRTEPKEERTDPDDQRAAFWARYATAAGIDRPLPRVLSGDKLGTLTFEPILCYFLCLTGLTTGGDESEISNRNEIYAHLVNEMWRRQERQDEDKKGPILAFSDQEDFEQILEYIALAGWHTGDPRTASAKAFEAAICDTDAQKVWTQFQEHLKLSADTEDGKVDRFRTLALTFFFRSKYKDEQGFEFLHKTFGEYFAARCVMRYLRREETIEAFRNLPNSNSLTPWLTLTEGAPLTEEIAEFIDGEFSLLPKEKLGAMRDGLANAMKLTLRDGMPVSLADGATWRTGETKQRNAEGTLLYCLAQCSATLIRMMPNTAAVAVLPENSDSQSISYLIKRLHLGKKSRSLFNLQGLEVIEADLQEENLQGGNFRYANLSDSNFIVANLQSADLRSSDLRSAVLASAKCRKARLDHADLRMTVLSQADLEKTSLRGARLENARLHYANFAHADFDGAKLQGAALHGADLQGARGLAQEQLDSAMGDWRTKLPEGLTRPDHWEKNPASSSP